MPIIHFKPVESKGKTTKKDQNKYHCPCYVYPIRTGTREKPSFMLVVKLPTRSNMGVNETDFWVKRGTALLMSLAD